MEQLDSELSLENEFHKETPRIRHRGLLFVLLAIVLAAGVTVAGILLFPNASGGIVINEVMTSNHGAYVHPAYGTVDWVELYNPTEKDFDLSGCGFTDSIKDVKRTIRYHFPDGTILPAGGYLVLYCTGGTGATDDDPFCTGFHLSAEGETLFLISESNVEIAELIVPPLDSDVSYARTESGDYAVTESPTPGEKNRFE
jgi:hypothetical protein